MLVVANGGIRTHPDTGRAKLDLETMSSSLAILDTADGRRVRSASLDARHRRLSIRHLDIDRDARIVIAMQHEGDRRKHVPVIAFERDARLVPVYAPRGVDRRMRQYAGSVSFDASGHFAAVTHPHDGIVSLWTTRPVRLLSLAELADTCGVAPDLKPGSFVATGAHGQIMHIDAPTGGSRGAEPVRRRALGQSSAGASEPFVKTRNSHLIRMRGVPGARASGPHRPRWACGGSFIHGPSGPGGPEAPAHPRSDDRATGSVRTTGLVGRRRSLAPDQLDDPALKPTLSTSLVAASRLAGNVFERQGIRLERAPRLDERVSLDPRLHRKLEVDGGVHVLRLVAGEKTREGPPRCPGSWRP